MAELVDASVSKTDIREYVPVRFRPGVPAKKPYNQLIVRLFCFTGQKDALQAQKLHCGATSSAGNAIKITFGGLNDKELRYKMKRADGVKLLSP